LLVISTEMNKFRFYIELSINNAKKLYWLM